MEREACVCDHGFERSDLCAEIILIIIIIIITVRTVVSMWTMYTYTHPLQYNIYQGIVFVVVIPVLLYYNRLSAQKVCHI